MGFRVQTLPLSRRALLSEEWKQRDKPQGLELPCGLDQGRCESWVRKGQLQCSEQPVWEKGREEGSRTKLPPEELPLLEGSQGNISYTILLTEWFILRIIELGPEVP